MIQTYGNYQISKNLYQELAQQYLINKYQLIMQEQSYRDEKEVNNQILFKVTAEYFHSVMHRSIGALTARDRYHRLVKGTATLISKNLILTAAHNIYDKQKKIRHTQFKFYPAANDIIDTENDGYQIEEYRFSQQFQRCTPEIRIKYDFALMKIKQNIQKPIELNQFLCLEPIVPNCIKQALALSIFGYPCFPPIYPNFIPKDPKGKELAVNQFGLTCEKRVVFLDFNKYQIAYAINAYPGHSGSPIICNNRIIGIHNGGGLSSENFNVGRFIDPSFLSNIRKWTLQMNAQLPNINDNPQLKDITIQIVFENLVERFGYQLKKNRKIREILKQIYPEPSYYLSLMYKSTVLFPDDQLRRIQEQKIDENEKKVILKVVPCSVRLYFYKIIYPQNEGSNIRDYFEFVNIPDQQTQRASYIQFIINLYERTTTRYYLMLNQCLRSYQTFFESGSPQLLKLIVQLVKIHKYLPIQRNIAVYRAMRFFIQNQTQRIMFSNFTATSPNRQVANSFLGVRGTFFQFKNITGRAISNYSLYPQDDQVLLLPFSHFFIQRKEIRNQVCKISAAELPGPFTYSKNIIIWVHDDPTMNPYPQTWRQQFDFEVIYLLSTRLFLEWFKIYGWLLSWKEIKVRIVTSMNRIEQDGPNQQAGLNLLKFLYRQKFYNEILVIECHRPERYQQKITELGIKGKWKIDNSVQNIKKFVSFA